MITATTDGIHGDKIIYNCCVSLAIDVFGMIIIICLVCRLLPTSYFVFVSASVFTHAND